MIVKKLMHKVELYNINLFKELVLISILPHNKRNRAMIGSSPQATGRAIGNILSSVVANASYNTSYNKQLAIRLSNDKVITFNTNNIDNSNELIDTLAKTSGITPQFISTKEYFAWKRGELEQFRSNPSPKSKAFLQAIKPYYKAKYFFYTPIAVFFALIMTTNLFFNWTHYHFKQKTLENLDNQYFLAKNEHINFDGDKFVDIVSKNGKPLLSSILIHEGRFGADESDTVFHFAFYPYDNPFFLSRIINLDKDKEPEILFSPDGKHGKSFKVYDFNPSTNTFEIKPTSSFANNLSWYTQELKAYKNNTSYFIGNTLLAYLVLYFLALLIFHAIVSGLKKNLKDSL